MSYYNGLVDFHFSICINADNHDECLFVSKKFKEYLNSWSFILNSSPSESKSARKGDVLSREIQSSITSYPSDIIAFREGLRCIVFHYDISVKKNLLDKKLGVTLIDHGTIPKNCRKNLFP